MLTVPDLARFQNFVRRLLGRQGLIVNPQHLREYTLTTVKAALNAAEFEVLRSRGIGSNFRGPIWWSVSSLRTAQSVLCWATYFLSWRAISC